MSTPIISIICDVYNHEPYIRQCLEGLVNQQTSFPFEILIHDDASTDHSQKIIREYEANYPDLFKPIYQTENKYSKRINIWYTFQFPRVRGKYIAFCEGDDYWTDPLKLEKQVVFLESNPHYILSHTRTNVFNQKQNALENYSLACPITSYKKLLKENRITTVSACIRADIIMTYSNLILKGKDWKIGDYPLWLYAAGCGKIHFLNEPTCVYRVLPISASHHERFSDILKFQEEVVTIKQTLLKCHRIGLFQKWYILNQTYLSLLELCLKHQDKDGVQKYFSKSLPYDKRSFKIWIQYFKRKNS